MKFINENRSDAECLDNCILKTNNNNKEIKWLKNQSVKQIRYMDNQYRIYEARKNWKRIITDTIDLLL